MPDLSPELLQIYVDMAWPVLTNLSLAALILVVGWMASKWANRLILRMGARQRLDTALTRFTASIAQYATLAAFVIAALDRMGMQTTSLVAIFASAGLAVGLALQGSLSNFASGVLILFFRPFQLGDVITVAGVTGMVEDIGIFTTTLIPPDNQKIIVPNAQVTGGVIVNITAMGTRRGGVNVGVAYGTDLAVAEAALLRAANSAALVLKDPAPAVAFVDLGASSLDFTVLCWSKSEDYLGMLHQVRSAVYRELNDAGIEIPFSQIVVHQA
ncbi:MAG: mechanosensitive ion channel family protein [Deltaproteobacteria bacterium]|nr:mechanosensitive ion channel family protein [Deltaproteobacteria bacterium]